MMKKFFIVLMVLVVALAVVACGGPAVDETLGENNGDQTNPSEEHVHAYEEEITPATCTTVGKVVTKCACGDVQGEIELPFAEHTQSVVDCEKDTVCTTCGTVLAEKTGHTIAATEVVTAPTCAAAGKEKGVCAVCSKVVESEIPSTGHVLAADGAVAIVDGGFSITCATCSQKVTLKAQDPLFKHTFDNGITEIETNDLGLEIVKPQNVKIVDGALSVNGTADVVYINVPDANKLADLGAFLISYDYVSTHEGAEGDMASMVSFLGNFYNGANTGSATVWGWLTKLVESKNVISTVNVVDKITDANSLAIERNTKYSFQIVVVPTARVAHVFVNGTYIGNSGQIPTLSKLGQNNLTLRFGDGPKCGHLFDNFVIADLK